VRQQVRLSARNEALDDLELEKDMSARAVIEASDVMVTSD
jgi:molybdopterin-binding protein